MNYEEIVLRINESVRVGPALIELYDTKHGHAKLGITAPRAVPIWRSEIAPKKKEPK